MVDEYPDNKYKGLMLGSVELRENIDLNAIPPNGKRPEPTDTSEWVFPGKPGID